MGKSVKNCELVRLIGRESLQLEMRGSFNF